MKITALETLRPTAQSNVLFVRLHGDDGATGLGEAFYAATTVEEYLHSVVAPIVLDLDDPTPEIVARQLTPYTGYASGGIEIRSSGAVDMALWDLVGKRYDIPLVQLLGGPARGSVRVYNTCAGSGYVARTTRQHSANWGFADDANLTGPERYEDLQAFLTRPRDLTRELLDEGITAMKVWPFDLTAEETGGLHINRGQMGNALRILDGIRDEAGSDMDLLVELHALWSPRAAEAICEALREYQPYWVEDPLRPDLVSALAELRQRTGVPIATGETITGRRAAQQLLQARALDVLTIDPGWTGGLTEARKVASLADTYGTPIAPHDCTGPVSLAVAAALTLSQPNGLIQETTRAFIRSWYRDLAEGLPTITNGTLRLTEAPGHGITLRDPLDERHDVSCRITRAGDL